jgi:hypothetical protein
VIADSFYSDVNNNRKDNIYLRSWVGCSFKGDESFEAVAQKLRVSFSRIGDYLNYVLKLPKMDSLIRIKNGKFQKGLMISLLMSLECFSRLLNESNNMNVPFVDDSNGGKANTPEEGEYILEAWKKTFYNVYSPMFDKMNNTTLIDQARYD